MGQPERWREIMVESPFGPVRVALTERGVLAAERDAPAAEFRARVDDRLSASDVPPQGALARAVARLLPRVREAVSSADPMALASSDIPLDGRGLPDWDRRVYEAARRIPPGSITSYGRLARAAGAPGAARAVGGAVGRNPYWLFVPCHRVIPADGTLGGYGRGAWSLELKRALLEREGIELPAKDFWG
jgi:O-6-methylguanine DNA methyltransferase